MLIKAVSDRKLFIAEINPLGRLSAFLFLFFTWFRTLCNLTLFTGSGNLEDSGILYSFIYSKTYSTELGTYFFLNKKAF